MKRIYLVLFALILSATCCMSASAALGAKSQKRIAYTLKKLNINKEQQAKLKPMLVSYLTDLKASKKKYDDMKDKYATVIDKGTLSDNVGQALLNAKFEAEDKETEVKKTYAKKFATVLSAKKVYLCFTYINDKMSKVEGKKKSKDEDDDDE